MKLRNMFAGAMAVLATGSAFATVHESFSFFDVDSDGVLGSAVNQIRNFNATGLTGSNVPYDLGMINVSGTITKVQTADFPSEGRVQIKHPDGRVVQVQCFTQANSAYTTLAGSASVYFGPMSNPEGIWEARFYETFNDGGDGAVDKIWNVIQIDFTDDVIPPPADRPSAEDKGTVCNPGMTFGVSLAAAQVNWYKVEVPESTGGNNRYLDIDTEGSSTSDDSEIGLYRDDYLGSLVATDDDDGTSFLSQLSFGPDAGDRGNGGFGGANYNGRDGNLTAGTYYLAVGTFNSTFGVAGYNVTSTGPAADLTVNFRTNMVCAVVEGVINLQDLDGDEAGCEVTIEVRDVGNFIPLEVHTVTLGPGGAYSFSSSLPDGNYDVTAKGTHWLRQLQSNVAFSNGASGLNFDLVNGDADPDNEVNLVDAAALSAAFGSVEGDLNWNPNADLNKDGEVNLFDWGILAARFGQVGDD